MLTQSQTITNQIPVISQEDHRPIFKDGFVFQCDSDKQFKRVNGSRIFVISRQEATEATDAQEAELEEDPFELEMEMISWEEHWKLVQKMNLDTKKPRPYRHRHSSYFGCR